MLLPKTKNFQRSVLSLDGTITGIKTFYHSDVSVMEINEYSILSKKPDKVIARIIYKGVFTVEDLLSEF